MIGNVNRIDQIDAMRQGVDYHFEVSVRNFRLILRPLSIKETVDVANRVMQRLTELRGVEANLLTEHTLLAQETLTLASTTDVGVNDPKFTAYIMDRLTPDELNFIFKQYVAGCDRVNPSLEKMSIEQIEKLVDDVKKNPDWAVNPLLALIGLSLSQLANLSSHLLTKGD